MNLKFFIIIFFISWGSAQATATDIKAIMDQFIAQLSNTETLKSLLILYAGHKLGEEEPKKQFQIKTLIQNLNKQHFFEYHIKQDFSDQATELKSALSLLEDTVDEMETSISNKVVNLKATITGMRILHTSSHNDEEEMEEKEEKSHDSEIEIPSNPVVEKEDERKKARKLNKKNNKDHLLQEVKALQKELKKQKRKLDLGKKTKFYQ